MINHIAGGVGIIVSGDYTSIPNISQNSNNPIQVMLRINGSTVQVFDGYTWLSCSSNVTVTLDPPTLLLLEWAKKKMVEEQEIEILSNDHPAVYIAKENLNKVKAEMFKAEQQLKATVILSKDYSSLCQNQEKLMRTKRNEKQSTSRSNKYSNRQRRETSVCSIFTSYF